MAGLDGDGQGELALRGAHQRRPATASGAAWSPIGFNHESLHWSPDDTRIIARPDPDSAPSIVDALGASLRQPSWIIDGAESWQRLAP